MTIDVRRVCDIRLDEQDFEQNVELYSFLLENNIYYKLNEHLVASPEQLAFMVALSHDQLYVPCSDAIFFDLMKRELPPRIRREYGRAWRINMDVLNSLPLDDHARRNLRIFCLKRLRRTLLFHDIIPSRLVKRLTSVLISPADVDGDPWKARRSAHTALQAQSLKREVLRALLDELPLGLACPVPRQPAEQQTDRHKTDGLKTDSQDSSLTADDRKPDGLKTDGQAADETSQSLRALRQRLDRTTFARLACLSAHDPEWALGDAERIRTCFARAEARLAELWDEVPALKSRHSTILLLCDATGGACYDLKLAHFLIERGHRVVYAVKNSFYFNAPTLQDLHTDPALHELVRDACLCENEALSKKELLRLLREWRLIIIGDGTRERLNLLRVSITFSRAWKEADLVLAKGWRLKDILLGTSHEFTRDIVCWQAEGNGFDVAFKPHAPWVRKLSERDINGLADGIIAHMREAHASGRPVIFYSCIIGSIPGQTKTALRLAVAIVDHLQKRLPNACIINPARHFVEGMDGDDLMYMWERVQRSGLINIWFFQTADDIEEGFRLLNEPMPEQWIGKDATYSTGCTKEMHIALEVQKLNPEMQIRGPDPRTFFRRGEYGVGKYFDATLVRR